MKPKQRTCKICKEKFEPNPNLFLPPTCEKSECRYEYAMKHLSQKGKEEKTTHRKALKQFNDSDANVMKRKAIHTFNAFIRARDKDKPCVSCGVIVKENMAHASHFKPANTYSYLRFDESNVHKSCSKCNVFLSGNLNEYRIRIVERIGQIELDRLDMPNQSKKWSIEELKNIIKTYKQKIKQI